MRQLSTILKYQQNCQNLILFSQEIGNEIDLLFKNENAICSSPKHHNDMINPWFNQNMHSTSLFGGIAEDSNIEKIFEKSPNSEANNLLSTKIDKFEESTKQDLNSSTSILNSHNE